MGSTRLLLFVAILATATLAEIAKFRKCDEVSVPPDICTVTEVRITPCPNPTKCVFLQGTNTTLSFDFTPNFTASKLKTWVYWENGLSDILFADMGSDDGCTYTQCPTESGKTQTLNYNLYINRKLAKGTYLIKWKVANEEDTKHQFCCFRTTIAIKKNKHK